MVAACIDKPSGNRRTMTDPDGGLFTYGYDLAGRQTVQQNPLNQRTTWTYDDADRTTAEELANRARTSYVYDHAGRVTGLRNMDSSLAVLSSFTYTYDRVGNRTAVQEGDGSRVSWTYDKTYQLTREHRTGGVSFDVTYTYDPAGNRLVQEDSGALTTYAYDAANELLTAEDSSGTTTFTYDATGNRRTKEERVVGVTTYAWDPQDRLVAVYKPSQRTFTFVYNAAGQRITRQTCAGERNFVYDRNKPLLETGAGAQTTLTYDYSNRDEYGELLSRRHQGVTDFHQYDALGSTRHLLDEAQSPTGSYIYRAFGKVESKTGATENHQLYVGRYGYFAEEQLALYFLNARWYDLATGQFLSIDPIGFEGGYNLYAYVGSSPIGRVDGPGTDFVAVGDRRVTWDPLPHYHYSLQWWRCFLPLTPLNCKAGFTVAQIKNKCEPFAWSGFFWEAIRGPVRAKKLGSMELLPQRGWEVWVSRKKGKGREWATKSVWISQIVYREEATKIMPIFDHRDPAVVKQVWARIHAAARAYLWAEQPGFALHPRQTPSGLPKFRFKHWPRSMYKSWQTNSNTFVREMVRKAGLTMTEMSKYHPGNDTPSQNTDNDRMTGVPLKFFPLYTPYRSGRFHPKPAPRPP